ncbi:hypothetical protein D0Z67_18345 [Streptomyces seoulensis]|uniref:Uncharacterized protein n=1 Tax=Streptomyces seoulensis TaxID=73044 RepID=A0A4V0ZZS0_STRSO|nr:hypothetical protein D0Z67_18345 [Streptomyces seoulensis]
MAAGPPRRDGLRHSYRSFRHTPSTGTQRPLPSGGGVVALAVGAGVGVGAGAGAVGTGASDAAGIRCASARGVSVGRAAGGAGLVSAPVLLGLPGLLPMLLGVARVEGAADAGALEADGVATTVAETPAEGSAVSVDGCRDSASAVPGPESGATRTRLSTPRARAAASPRSSTTRIRPRLCRPCRRAAGAMVFSGRSAAGAGAT